MRRGIVALIAIALAGCASGPLPITAATPQRPDDRLVGLWQGDVAARGWVSGRKQADRHFETYAPEADERQLRQFIADHAREVFADAGPLLERVRADEPPTPSRR